MKCLRSRFEEILNVFADASLVDQADGFERLDVLLGALDEE